MEEGWGSGGGFVKKKTSSGCLIIKKKVDGTGGVRASGSGKVFESNKERKRPRLDPSDSESSDELLQPFTTKVVSNTDKFGNTSVVYRGYTVGHNKFGCNGEIGSERKRIVGVSEFDDLISGKRTRKEDRFKSEMKTETGSIRHVNRQKHSYFDSNTSNSSSGRKEVHGHLVKSRFEIEDGEAHRPTSSSRQNFQRVSNETIRLQGKNGVLKVMVNKNKKMIESPHKFHGHPLEFEERKGSRYENAVKYNVSSKPSIYSTSKSPEKGISIVRTEKNEIKLQKPLSMCPWVGNSESEDSDTLLRLGPTSTQACSSLKGIKKNEKKALSAEKIAPVEGKEGKTRRGYGTEKQLLRDKIRSMLVSAGWTIDYRPRRNRDYLDAVYINPNGTAYWSIIKAYEAFQKQSGVEDVDIKPSSQFTPVPEELLRQLTRRTRKKIENEMKLKQRDNFRGTDIEESVEGTGCDKVDEKQSFTGGKNGELQKRRSPEIASASGDDSSGTLCKESPKREGAEKPVSNSHIIRGRKCQDIGGCTLLIQSGDKELNSESGGYVPCVGKRTLLSWLIESGTVHLSEKVQYMNRRRTKVTLEGWITRDGIHCGCCSKILSISKFEIHAGSKLRQPFQNIYLESGVSLLQCLIDAWNRQEESRRCGFHTVDMDGDDQSDDTCGLCGDGGDLICCDGCPSTFHQSCLEIKMLPHGPWHCSNCTCKFCGIAGGTTAPRNGKTVCALQTCRQCEKKYHESCSQEMDALPDDSTVSSTSFCGQECRELFEDLQKLLGVKHELEAGFSWSLIHRTELDTDTSHRCFPQRVECNSKLAVALCVMDECFLPIVDRKSGINLIHEVLYNSGSNFSRLNCSGFYTAILERGDEIITAASIRYNASSLHVIHSRSAARIEGMKCVSHLVKTMRTTKIHWPYKEAVILPREDILGFHPCFYTFKIHGTQLAELPFIGTRRMYRHQGMCRLLFRAIEEALCSLKVKKLIIPATSEHKRIWTVVFGFNPLEESHKQEMRSINMLVCPGTEMLQKLLVEQKVTDDCEKSGTRQS